jgi:curved DNA-binding protein CbpA
MPPQIDFDPSVDYYKALGLTDKASADEIKKAYRKLAKANQGVALQGHLERVRRARRRQEEEAV